jgi:uncharacterized protein (DUF1697 family)
VAILQELDLENVKTYIQSGNVVFQSNRTDLKELSEEISVAVGKNHGFTPHVMLLSIDDFQAAMAVNPFPEGEAEPKTLHLFFLDSVPQDPDLNALEAIKAESERYRLINNVFYLHAPDGIGRSKLAAKVERVLGVSTTARNWRTVSQIMTMVGTLSA